MERACGRGVSRFPAPRRRVCGSVPSPAMERSFDGFGADAFAWFEGLARDNTRAYFGATREAYEASVRGPLEALLVELQPEFGGEVRLMRQQRDLRFSRDRTPYKERSAGFLQARPGGSLYAELSARGVPARSSARRAAASQADDLRRAARAGADRARCGARARGGGVAGGRAARGVARRARRAEHVCRRRAALSSARLRPAGDANMCSCPATPTILHADLDAFYASVEQRDDPRLRGRPVIVGGGVVLAASYEAKALRRPHRDGRAAGAAAVPGRDRRAAADVDAYSEASKAVFEIFDDTTPLVEGLSIDEAFLDVGGLRRIAGTPAEIAVRLRARRARRGRAADHGRRRAHEVPGQGGERRRQARRAARRAARRRARRSCTRCRSSGCGASGRSDRGQAARARDHAPSARSRSSREATLVSLLGRGVGPPPARARAQPRPAPGRHAAPAALDRLAARARPRRARRRPSSTRSLVGARRPRRAGGCAARGRVGRTVVLRLRFDDFTRATRSHTLPRGDRAHRGDPRRGARAARRGAAADRAAAASRWSASRSATSTTTARSSSRCPSSRAAAARARSARRRPDRPAARAGASPDGPDADPRAPRSRARRRARAPRAPRAGARAGATPTRGSRRGSTPAPRSRRGRRTTPTSTAPPAASLDATLDELRDRFGSTAVTRAVLLGRDQGISVPLLPD